MLRNTPASGRVPKPSASAVGGVKGPIGHEQSGAGLVSEIMQRALDAWVQAAGLWHDQICACNNPGNHFQQWRRSLGGADGGAGGATGGDGIVPEGEEQAINDLLEAIAQDTEGENTRNEPR